MPFSIALYNVYVIIKIVKEITPHGEKGQDMKRYTYKNIRIRSSYGVYICEYVGLESTFRLATVGASNKATAYKVAKDQVDFLNGKQ